MKKELKEDSHKVKKPVGLKGEKTTHNAYEEDEILEQAERNKETALEHPNYSELEEKLTLTEQKAHENWEQMVRAIAERDNARRRAAIDVENAHRYGQERLITSMLPVIDSLEQAVQLAEKDKENQAVCEGLQLTLKLFLDTLEKQGIQQIDPEGQMFNPQEHEAMSMQEVASVAPNTVLTVYQKGYKLNDRVIRPARVIVAKAR